MLTLHPPPYAVTALELLERHGFEAYLVGGCVRDSLLGRVPGDFDIATNAKPEDILAVFAAYRTIPTGLRHGTITVMIGEDALEITTYRVDGDYSDHRRPDRVTFTGQLREDLARRDFTVNAMAWNPAAGLIDCFGGTDDLRRGIIRCVGEPDKRFEEDALRILRAARFACTLGFALESRTCEAMLRMKPLLCHVAGERIAAEINKAILGAHFAEIFGDVPEIMAQILPELSAGIGFAQEHPAHIYTVYEHTLRAVAAAPADVTIRLALLFHDAGKPSCFTVDANGKGHFYRHAQVSATMAEEALCRLHYSNAQRGRVVELVRWHDAAISPAPAAIRRWLHRLGEEAYRQLLEVQWADNAAKNPRFGKPRQKGIADTRVALEALLRDTPCYRLEDLAIKGDDLLAAGYRPGPALKKELERLLFLVIDGGVENSREDLLAAMKPTDKPSGDA
jgi:tRNA nucleotidyltransferase (CCA-adding enzyme)